jgi:nitroimidazol reductase NimA-like FMN-containing flavoprotein (pyridoxamine 5'-phosphate oxidase superfamily)
MDRSTALSVDKGLLVGEIRRMRPDGDLANPPSARTRVRREPHRGVYDRASIDAVLDAALVCHLAFVDGGQPFAVPTLHARIGDVVYVHGSAAGRALRVLAGGAPACLTVTLLDGLVLARSVFEHSVNYRSAVLLGSLRLVDDPAEKLAALEAFTDKLVPGRWAEARPPTGQELKATSVLALPIEEASTKIRTGPPGDGDSPDAALPIWAGTVPIAAAWGDPVPAPGLRSGVPVPASVRALLARPSPA